MARITGVATMLVVAATATGGLFALSTFGPVAPGDPVMPALAPATTEPDATSTSAPSPATTTTTTTATTTTAITTTTATTTTGPPPTEAPVSVSASSTIVGAGGIVTFDGDCADAGRVFVEIAGQTTDVLDIGVSDPSWRYDWTAPVDEAQLGGFAFRFFCGDPSDFTGSYPAELERRVDTVAIAPPPPPPTVLVESEPPVGAVLPETD